jgi:hypothetical protein
MSELNEMGCAEFAGVAAELALGVLTGEELLRLLPAGEPPAGFETRVMERLGLAAPAPAPPPSPLSSAALLTASHQTAGTAYFYDRGTRWPYMSVDIGPGNGDAGNGTVICQVEGADGHVTTVGSFRLAAATGTGAARPRPPAARSPAPGCSARTAPSWPPPAPHDQAKRRRGSGCRGEKPPSVRMK